MRAAGCQVPGLGPHFCLCSTISQLQAPTLGDDIQNKTVTCIDVEAAQMEGFGVKPVPGLGWWEPKNIFLLLCYKASLHSWKRAASREEQGLSMAQLVLMAPPGSSHPLPPFHYRQEGVRLAVR